MKISMKIFTLSLVVGLVLTIFSGFIISERGTALREFGCLPGYTHCHEGQLSGGYPWPYLMDAQGVSVIGELHVVTDHFDSIAFLIDVIIYSVLAAMIIILIKKLKLQKRKE